MEKKVTPMNGAQRGIYLECVENPSSLMYNIPVISRLPQGTDVARFIAAVKAAVAQHKALHVSASAPDGVPSMIYDGDREIEVAEKTVDSLAEECKAMVQPFDLGKGPLCRFEVCHTPEGDVFLFDVHHLVFDGTSLEVLLRHIAKFYEEGVTIGEEVTLFDIALEEMTLKDSDKYRAAQAYFKEKFDGVEWTGSPVSDVVDAERLNGAGEVEIFADGRFSADAVAAFAREAGVRENTVFLTAFAFTLSRMNGTSRSCFCTVDSGRYGKKGIDDTVGMFVNTLPLCFSLDDKAPLPELLRSVQKDFYETLKHDCIEFGDLVSEYGVGTGVTFVNQNEFTDGYPMAGGRLGSKLLPNGECPADIDFMLVKSAGVYSLKSNYRKSLYTEEYVRSFAQTFLNVVKGMLTAETLADVPLVNEEQVAVLDDFNRTEAPWPQGGNLPAVFREQARKTPDNICIVYRDRRYTYAEVDDISDRIAGRLLQEGVGKGSIAGVLIDRCEHMLICSLGVLKTGAAYIPLDPGYPAERINLMLGDSGATMLVHGPGLDSVVSQDYVGKRFCTDEIPGLPEYAGTLPEPSPTDTFVLIYTSGSTGTPKGVIFSHSNVLCTLEGFANALQMDAGSRYASYASYGFDAHIPDVYSVLLRGAQVHIIPEELRLDLGAVQEYFNAEGITHTTMTTQVGRQFALMEGNRSLRCLCVAGEKLTPLAPPEGLILNNCYGPTEGSVSTSHFRVDRLYRDVPVGKPFDNVKVYVVGPGGSRLPVGAVGELWISGPHVTGGYLNRPEKTAEAYGDNPFPHPEGYDRVYRTGDIVRLLCDGNIQFVGRRDAQVKVRGFRIELTEVEEVVRRCPGVKDATVAAFDNPSGGKFLCAYIVADEQIPAGTVADFVRSEKPYYMVPAAIMQIDSIPLNRNQKVDRKALPVPVIVADDLTPPVNETQTRIFDIAAEILGHREFGIYTNLQEAGLTSIGIIKLNVALGKAFGRAVKVSDIKEHGSVEALEKFLSGEAEAAEVRILEDYPLMQNQMGVFLDCSRDIATLDYNIPVLLKLSDGIDVQRLRGAVAQAIDAHPYIKATLFADGEGNVRSRRSDGAAAEVEVIETAAAPAAGALLRPFDLLGGRLYRAEIYVTPEGNYLFFDTHHIVSDGTSFSVFINDVNDAYCGKRLTVEKFTGFEAASEEERLRSGETYTEGLKYFEGLLGGCNTDCLPAKCPEPSETAGRKMSFPFGACSDALTAWCGERGVTANAFFNAVFAYTLSRFLHSDDVTYCTIYNGRGDSRFAETFAMLVKTLPVRVALKYDSPVDDFIDTVGRQIMDTMSRDAVSFSELSSKYGIRPDIFFNYQGEGYTFDRIGDCPAEDIPVVPAQVKSPLTLEVFHREGGYALDVTYSTEFYCAEFVTSLAQAVIKAAEEFTVRPVLKQVSVLSDAQKALFDEMNATDAPLEAVAAHKFFERAVQRHPDKVAVVTAQTSLTYAELDRMSDSIASSLLSMGARRGEIVGMVLERSEKVPAAELGILKAGCAYLPMLPSYPQERIDFCMKDASCRFVVTDANIDGMLACEPSVIPDEGYDPHAPVYCIYTSGSTGTPKGVMLEQHNFTNFVQFSPMLEMMGEDSTVLCMASISFDLSIAELLFSLCQGSTVYIATEEEVHNPMMLLEAFGRCGIDVMIATPSFALSLLSSPEFGKALGGLKGVMLAAEAFRPGLFDTLKSLNSDMVILNGYGPSETTLGCSFKVLTSGNNVTIGAPMANVKFYVTDESGNLLPRYAVGELVICGEGVGRGYINLPEKTAAAFTEIGGVRAYRSGDMVRINSDGEAEFFGRGDGFVKLRGFRVELSEIEGAVCAFPSVLHSTVIVRNNGREDYLAGFFTASSTVDTGKLTEYLQTRLPNYMVPSVLVQLEKIPMTPNGKIDKKALPETAVTGRRSSGTRKAARKSLEQRLCEMFASVLGVDEVYADDNFFELGGTSLSASKITMMLMSENIEVKYGDIFDNPTPEELAALINGRNAVAAADAETAAESVNTTREALKYNKLKYTNLVKREPLGGVLLTGATGFLGVHVLKFLLEIEDGHIWCLVRRGGYESGMQRLRNMLFYYFDDALEEVLPDRVTVLEADITDPKLSEVLKDIEFDTLINCAACVKHFVDDDILERINVRGVENLIGICKSRGKKLVQISTTSIPGAHTAETYEKKLKMHENELFVIDDMDNKYVGSKYKAELLVFDAVEDGMRGKVIRAGNLMGRHSDGEFQINLHTNMFLNGIRGFSAMGKCPLSHMTDGMRLSPIDYTARAVVLLAGVNDCFTAFNADNRNSLDEMKVIEACNRNGIEIIPTEDDEYYAEYQRKLGDDELNAPLMALAAYDLPDVHLVETDNAFTANVLFRLGFSWPLMDETYLDRVIQGIKSLDYFEL